MNLVTYQKIEFGGQHECFSTEIMDEELLMGLPDEPEKIKTEILLPKLNYTYTGLGLIDPVIKLKSIPEVVNHSKLKAKSLF